jgi:dTDP-4-dehydrorhamnose 3,5-epimerase
LSSSLSNVRSQERTRKAEQSAVGRRAIDGVQLVELVRHEDDRGFLYEMIHATDSFVHKFGQVYVVCSPVRGAVRAFHKHAVLWDYFCVVRGAGKFVLAQADDEEVRRSRDGGEECAPTALETYVLTERKPALLVVPPGIWHGWMALEDNTLLVSIASEVYNREDPDEVRTSPDVFGDVWPVKGR